MGFPYSPRPHSSSGFARLGSIPPHAHNGSDCGGLSVGVLLCSPIAVALNRWALGQDERPDVAQLV
jgi:hypothetical protein